MTVRQGLDLRGNTYWEFRLARGDTTSHPTFNSSAAAAANSSSSSQQQQPQQQYYPFRRIVHYPRSTHPSEVAVPPAWHQWLRYRRAEAPTLAEQVAEVARQERVRVLAAEADARWAAKPSLLNRSPPPPSPPPSLSPSVNEAAAAAAARGRRPVPATAPNTGRARPQGRAASEWEQIPLTPRQEEGGVGGRGAKSRAGDEKRTDGGRSGGDDGNPWKNADAARRGGPSETWQPEAWDPSDTPAPSSTSRGRR